MSKPVMVGEVIVHKVKELKNGGEQLTLKAVPVSDPGKNTTFYDDEPKGTIVIELTEPGLIGTFSKGDVFGLDFVLK